MFSFTRKKAEDSRLGRAIERMVELRGMKRHRSTRAHSAPAREPVTISHADKSMSSRSPSPNMRPMYTRGRSASCTALDWFAGALYWSDVEASGSFTRSGSYRSVHHYGQVMDMRHDRVKTATPVVIHQDRPYAEAALSAEVGTVETPASTAGQSAPPSTPVRNVSYAATSRGTVENIRADAIAQSDRRTQPYLSVEIPRGALSPSMGFE